MVKVIKESFNDAEKREIAYEKANQVVKMLNDKHLWADIAEINTEESNRYYIIGVEIEGDWKHDHGYADYLVNTTYDDVILEGQTVTQEGGSDYYTSIHWYRFMY